MILFLYSIFKNQKRKILEEKEKKKRQMKLEGKD